MTTINDSFPYGDDATETQSASSLARMWTSIRAEVRARRAIRKPKFELMDASLWRGDVFTATTQQTPAPPISRW